MSYTLSMTVQLHVRAENGEWFVYNGDTPVNIDGAIAHASRADVVAKIEARGRFVWDDGSVRTEPQPEPSLAIPTPDEDEIEDTPMVFESVEPSPPEVDPGPPEVSADPPPAKRVPLTAEEKKQRRAEYAKKYRAQMTDEQKEQARATARERQKKWRESHPEEAAKYAKRSSERRKQRYNEDPEFRAKYREQQREYAQGKDASGADD